MRMNLSAAFRALLILVMAGSLATPSVGQAPPAQAPPPVTVAKPVVKDVTEADDFTGRYDAIDYVEVRARVSGVLDRVAFTDGATVKKGDLLFVIDQRPYRAALEQAVATVQAAQSRVTFSQSDLERAQSLNRTGNITEQLLEQRRQTFQSAQADVAGGNAAVTNARLNLEFTEIRAPVAGRIGRKLISEGNLVSANTTLLTTIVSLDPIYFYFDIDERSFLAYSRQRAATRAAGKEPSSDALVGVTDEKEPTRKAKIDFQDNRIDQATGTIRARAIVPNPDLFLTPGLFGTIRVQGSNPYRGVLVPDEAIGTDQDRRIVWVVADDNSVSSRVVRPGPKIDGYRLVRDGLKGDETIVINGLQRVRPGAKVTPQRQDLPATRS